MDPQTSTQNSKEGEYFNWKECFEFISFEKDCKECQVMFPRATREPTDHFHCLVCRKRVIVDRPKDQNTRLRKHYEDSENHDWKNPPVPTSNPTFGNLCESDKTAVREGKLHLCILHYRFDTVSNHRRPLVPCVCTWPFAKLSVVSKWDRKICLRFQIRLRCYQVGRHRERSFWNSCPKEAF